MKTRVSRWRSSLALRIPRPLAVKAGLVENSPVELLLVEEKLVISPLHQVEYNLKQLLAQVTEENMHYEIDTGPAVGEEVW